MGIFKKGNSPKALQKLIRFNKFNYFFALTVQNVGQNAASLRAFATVSCSK